MIFFALLACNTTNLKQYNDSPEVRIYSHEDGAELTIGSTAFFVANVIDLNHDDTELTLTWTYGAETVCTDAYIDRNDDTFCELEVLPGVERIQISARDPANAVGSDIIQLVPFENLPPEAPVVQVSPENPSTADDLVATASSTDPNGDEVSFSYAWSLVSAPDNIVATTSQLSSSETERDQLWQVSVIPSDGLLEGPATVATVTIGNSTPVIDTLSITPNSVTNDLLLSCAGSASDVDGDELQLSYAWKINGQAVAQGQELQLTPELAMPGDSVSCELTAADLTDSTTGSATALVDNRPFVIEDLQLLPPAPTTEDTLEVVLLLSDPDDPSGETLNATFSWQVDGAQVQVGAAPLLAPFTAARNQLVVATVDITDGFASDSQSLQVAIVNAIPTSPSISLANASPIEAEDDLLCQLDTPSYDADGDALSYHFEWYVNGTGPFASPSTTTNTDDTVAANQLSLNQVWECRVSADDGQDLSPETSVTSNPVNGYCEVYVSQTCSQSTTVTNYGRHASCGVNNSCVWCCLQDYIDPDCEGWCNTAAGETPCPSWHAEYYNECTYTETITTTYDCSYTTTQLCN